MAELISTKTELGSAPRYRRFQNSIEVLMELRTRPALAPLEGEALMYLANRAVEMHFDEGEALFLPDAPVEHLYFIVEGKVRLTQEGVHLLDSSPPFGVGFFPVIAQSVVGQEARALEETVVLRIPGSAFFELLEDDVRFLELSISQSCRQMLELQEELDIMGHSFRTTPVDTPYPEGPLDLVERLSVVTGGPFEGANVEPLVELARGFEEIRVEAGEVFWEEGDPATWGLRILHGVIECSSDSRSFRMGSGSWVGLIGAQGNLPRAYRAVAESRVVALRLRADSFMDAFEDNFPLARGYISFMARNVLQLMVKVAKLRASN